MFRAIITPILRSSDCVYSLWYNAPMMLPAGNLDEMEHQFYHMQVTGRQHRRCIIPQAVNTVGAPEDGCNYRPKRVQLIGIINKPLLLHLVGCLYYCIGDARSYKHQICKNIDAAQNVLICPIYTVYNINTYLGIHVNCPTKFCPF